MTEGPVAYCRVYKKKELMNAVKSAAKQIKELFQSKVKKKKKTVTNIKAIGRIRLIVLVGVVGLFGAW